MYNDLRDIPHIIELPKISDYRGSLTFFEYPNQIPFEINGVYWIYDVPSGWSRLGHVLKDQCELILALSGSFDVSVHNGKEEGKFSLDRSNVGLLVPKSIWVRLENISINSVALVVTGMNSHRSERICDFVEF
jgi:hypothetical protein